MGLVKTTRANKEAVSDPKLHLALTAVGQKSIDCNENSNMNIEQHRRRGNNIWTITATQQPKGTKLCFFYVFIRTKGDMITTFQDDNVVSHRSKVTFPWNPRFRATCIQS